MATSSIRPTGTIPRELVTNAARYEADVAQVDRAAARGHAGVREARLHQLHRDALQGRRIGPDDGRSVEERDVRDTALRDDAVRTRQERVVEPGQRRATPMVDLPVVRQVFDVRLGPLIRDGHEADRLGRHLDRTSHGDHDRDVVRTVLPDVHPHRCVRHVVTERVPDPIADQVAVQSRIEQFAVGGVEPREMQLQAAHRPTADLHRGEVPVRERREAQLFGRRLTAVDLRAQDRRVIHGLHRNAHGGSDACVSVRARPSRATVQ